MGNYQVHVGDKTLTDKGLKMTRHIEFRQCAVVLKYKIIIKNLEKLHFFAKLFACVNFFFVFLQRKKYTKK